MVTENQPNELDILFVVQDGHSMPIDKPTAKVVVRMLMDKGMDAREIAQRIQRSHNTVRNWIAEWGYKSDKKKVEGPSRYESRKERETRLRQRNEWRARRTSPAMQDKR